MANFRYTNFWVAVVYIYLRWGVTLSLEKKHEKTTMLKRTSHEKLPTAGHKWQWSDGSFHHCAAREVPCDEEDDTRILSSSQFTEADPHAQKPIS